MRREADQGRDRRGERKINLKVGKIKEWEKIHSYTAVDRIRGRNNCPL